jgi:hypothetical protein
MLNRHIRAGLAVVVIALGACGDSTAPHTVTPAQLARHLDSLSVAAAAASNTGRLVFLGQAEGPPANGVAPVAVTVTTRSGPHAWKGFVSKYSGSKPFGPTIDSLYFLFAYSDYAMTDFLVAQVTYFHSPYGPLSQIWLLSDTTWAFGGSGTFSMETRSAGAACTPTLSGLRNYGLVAQYTVCDLASFSGALSWTLPGTSGETADFATVTIKRQEFNGIILQ